MNEQAETRPDLRCYHHPGREATNQCDRCGDYLCDDCVRPLGAELICTACYDRHFGDSTLSEHFEHIVWLAWRALRLIAIIGAVVLLVIIGVAIIAFLVGLYG